jgi:flavin reductase (DIM6/NTAB) family NADH-FMN oxidoreductase RutF
MKYAPHLERCPLPFSPFKSCTVPRPIGWLSSVSRDGIENIAPYSQWQNLTFDPPMVMFSANQYPDGRRKDTVINAEETGWFVWNMATYALRDAVNLSAMALPANESEFDRLNVTRVYADNAPIPMVGESPCKFECRYISTHRLKGRSPVGSIDVVFAQVEKIHIDDSVIRADGRLDIAAIQPIARMGYFDYAVVRDTFEMRVPDSDSDAQAGLEGRADVETSETAMNSIA